MEAKNTFSDRIKEINVEFKKDEPILPVLLNAILKIEHDSDTHLYFRGESQKYPFVIPSLYRSDNEKLIFEGSENYYRDLISELGRDDYNESTSLVRTMAEFRHYGAVTRILDVSKNPLASIYFSAECDEDEDGFVYIFSPKHKKYDTGHTIAIKTALNLMNQTTISSFLIKCESLINLYGITNNVEITPDYEPLQKYNNAVNNSEEDSKGYDNSKHLLKALDDDFMILTLYGMKYDDLIDKKKMFIGTNTRDKSYKENESLFNDAVRWIRSFMEALNQRARVRERLEYPFRIFDDLNKTHLVISSMNTDRINRQRGAFLFPAYVKTCDEYENNKPLSVVQNEVQDSIFNCLYMGPSGNVIRIPAEHKKKIKEELFQLGIDGGFLYSDIQHQSETLLAQYRK